MQRAWLVRDSALQGLVSQLVTGPRNLTRPLARGFKALKALESLNYGEHPLESRTPPVGRCQEVAETISLLWSVSDRTWLADLEHPGFTLVDGSQLWIHQPLLDPGSSDAKQRLQEPRGRRPPFCRSQPAGLRSCGSEALFKTPKDIHGK